MKVSSPLFSLDASGTLGKVMTFSRRASGQQVRFQRKQRYSPSYTQSRYRSVYVRAVLAWNALTTNQKDVYIDRAIGKEYTGYNLFISEYIKNSLSGLYGVKIYGLGFYGALN